MRVTSGLGRLSTCPHQFELLQLYPPEDTAGTFAGAAWLGTCFHRAMEFYFTEVLNTGKRPDLSEVCLAFDDAWQEASLSSMTWGSKKDPDSTAESSYEDGLGLLNIYFPTAETLTPKLVEWHWELEFEGEPLEGTLDLLTEDGKMIDFKTGRVTKSQLDADTSIQLSVYAWALRQFNWWGPLDATVAFHSVTRHKKVYSNGRINPDPYKTKIVESKRNLVNYEWIDELYIPRLIEMHQSGRYPAQPGTHCVICPVKEHCGHWESIESGRGS